MSKSTFQRLYEAEGEKAQLQARLDAIAAIVGDLMTLDYDERKSIRVLARGTPAREVRALTRKYGRKAK